MVELEVSDGVAWLTLNRPAKLNALDRTSVRELTAHLRRLSEREDARVVVTRGAGRAFCAGSDLADLAPLSPAEAAAAEAEHAAAGALYDAVPVPTIAMLHGYVLGGGLGLALYHDFRIAAASANLGMPEIELGWTPPWAMGRLVDVVGGANARWLALTGIRVSGAEAQQLGLVNEVVADEQLAERVEAFARRLAALSPTALRETKDLLVRMSPLRRAEWDEAASAAFARCFATPEARANVERFLRKSHG
ncbi:MAG TPA: enoyl-CoA hydratase/isomerase family protein [Chloroflexota bacterium]|nr:enoyl-CoA hydratase/isomerase family protein [Chloroflexota bacterium]